MTRTNSFHVFGYLAAPIWHRPTILPIHVPSALEPYMVGSAETVRLQQVMMSVGRAYAPD